MLTEKRLNETYKNAKEISFDDNSKFIFFSDIHRGDNSMSDEFAHNQSIYYHALEYYYEKEYTYVEVGDGEELWEHAKFNYIRRAHSDVYELIKKFYNSDRFIMLFGNHNVFLKNPYFVEKNLYHYYDDYLQKESHLFPGIIVYESIILKHKQTSQEIFVVHGHQGDLINDQLWRLSMFMLRYFWRYMHIVGFKNPASPAKNIYKQHKIERNFNKWNRLNGVMMICGHTHRPKFPSRGEMPYFNTGCCVHPRGITGIEITNGKIMMVSWRVTPDKNGFLQINRTIIHGPTEILDFEDR
ncbi:MAG: serine/threonine protein phosphatase [Clostridiaceae bacterium]|nr:serine/threonine protein phosphatase [Clostridiaceae bacterium]